MRRKIEEITQKREKIEQEISEVTERLADVIGRLSLSSKKKTAVKHLLEDFTEKLKKLILVQDKEWDMLSNNHYTGIFNSLQNQISEVRSDLNNFRSLTNNFIELERRLNNIIERLNQFPDKESIDEIKSIKSQLSPVQYSDFEERFRGSKEDILQRQRKFLRYFEGKKNILDIGCGRGEFMKLLLEHGISSEGVDISGSMLKEAEKEGLKCFEGDALKHLKKKKAGSLGGIFSAQVIEHLPPDYLKELISESFRVLESSGIILLETINPLSVFAITNIYYLDITHKQPLHPEFMRYLLSSYGFESIELIYSAPPEDLQLEEIPVSNDIALQFNRNSDKLNKVLFNSTDYAIVGIKP